MAKKKAGGGAEAAAPAGSSIITEDRLGEQRLRDLVNLSPGVIYARRACGDFGATYVSEQVEKVMGYTAQAFIGDAAFWQDHVHPDDRGRALERLKALSESNESTQEYRFLHADGGYRWIHDKLCLVRDAQGASVEIVGLWMDISGRKRTEEALRASEARFRSLTELSSDSYAEQDECFRYTRGMPKYATASIFDEEEILGKTRWELGITPEPGHDMAAHQRTLAAHLPFRDFEYSAVVRGSRRYLSTNGIPLFDEQGNFTGYACIGSDITERKQAEYALRQSEQRFRDLVELASDWYWEQDADLRFSSPARGRRANAPFSTDFARGKLRWELPIVSVSAEQWQAHRALLARREPFHDFVYETLDGQGGRRWTSVSGKPVFGEDGQFLGYRGTGRDITAQVCAERALRESEARLREAQRMARLGSWELDLLTGKLTWSDEIFRIFEIDPQRFGASYEAFLAAVHPADREAVNEAYTRSVRDRVPYEITHRLLLRDGRIKHVHEHGQTAYDGQGRPLRSIGTVQDVSEQKQVEAELRTSADRLQSMARRLGEAQEIERRRLAAELHDGVCSNLAAIGLNLALLHKQLPHRDPAAMQRNLSDLIALVDEAKANAKDISVDLRPLLLEDRDLFPALEEYARKFEGSTGIAVEVNGANSGRRLPPEKKIALFRIAQEALTNCARHAQASAIAIEFNADSDHLLLSVADNGVGIDLAGAGGKTQGLGLLSMQERAEAIGGRWQIETTPGKGTRVSVSVGAALG